MAELDAVRVLTAPDGMDYWRRHVHSRCDVTRRPVPVLCPWCEEFDGPSGALVEARAIVAARLAERG